MPVINSPWRLASVALAALGLATICSSVLAQLPQGLPRAGNPGAGAPNSAPNGAAPNGAAPAGNAPGAAAPRGAGPGAPPTGPAGAPVAGRPADPEAEAAAARYRMPNTNDPQQLMDFLTELRKFQPRDTQTYLLHRKQLPRVVYATSQRIMQLEKDTSSNLYLEASTLFLVSQVELLPELNPAEQRALFNAINDRLKMTQPTQADFFLGMQFATRLESTPNNSLSAETYVTFAKYFADSGNPEIAEMGKAFANAGRRMSLVGRPMEVFGNTLDGRPFDWQSYQGKVVLVDYWATWCEPCRREIPNVKRLYRLYHSRGFDVVGINVDDTREPVDAFVKAEEIPWVNLFDTNKSGEHPMATHYGVVGYPTVILVGRDGKVVSLDARGEKLEQLLTRLLGPSGEEPPANAKNARPPGQRGS